MILKALWSLYGRFRSCDGYSSCACVGRTNRIAWRGHIYWLCGECERELRRDQEAIAKVHAATWEGSAQ